jgi:hypothetical protein
MAWIGDDDQSPELSKWIEGQLNVKVKDVKTSTLSVPMYYPIKGKMLRLNYAVVRPANIVRD